MSEELSFFRFETDLIVTIFGFYSVPSSSISFRLACPYLNLSLDSIVPVFVDTLN